MASLDESRNYNNFGDQETVQPVHLIQLPETPLPVTSLLGEEKSFSDATTEKTYALGIEDIPTLVNLNAVRESSPYSVMMDGLPIDQQETWLLPRVQGSRKAPKIETQVSGVEGYTLLIRNLVTSSGIYALASLASPLVSLALMPFLTHTLSHNEYGALAVLNAAIALMAGLTQFGLGNAFFRAYSCDYESQRDRLDVVSTVIVLLSLTSIPISIAAIIAAPWLSVFLLKSAAFGNAVRLAALVVLMQNLTVPGLSWLRVENRATIYSALAITNLLANLGAAIILVGTFHMGINGALLAVGGGYGVIVICTLPVAIFRAGLRLRADISHNLLSFGLPLVSNFVSVWVLQLSDRYLLSHFGSLAQTASYAVAYGLGGVLNVVVQAPFSLAWPAAMFAIAKRDDAPRVFQLVFRWYSMVLLFAAFAFSLASTSILDLFFPPAYHSAAPVIPIVTLSIMFYSVYNVFNTGISIKRKTWFAVIFTSVAAFINVGFNIVLIPLYGSMGAAWSTLLAYAILTVIAYIVNQYFYPISYEIGTFIIALGIGLGLYIGSNFLTHGQGMYTTWGISLAALGLYIGCLALLGNLLVRRNKNTFRQQPRESFLS